MNVPALPERFRNTTNRLKSTLHGQG